MIVSPRFLIWISISDDGKYIWQLFLGPIVFTKLQFSPQNYFISISYQFFFFLISSFKKNMTVKKVISFQRIPKFQLLKGYEFNM